MERTLEVRIKVNASKSEILSEDPLVVAVKAKPIGGAANRELVKFLSKHFKAEVKIVRGLASRKKLITIKA